MSSYIQLKFILKFLIKLIVKWECSTSSIVVSGVGSGVSNWNNINEIGGAVASANTVSICEHVHIHEVGAALNARWTATHNPDQLVLSNVFSFIHDALLNLSVSSIGILDLVNALVDFLVNSNSGIVGLSEEVLDGEVDFWVLTVACILDTAPVNCPWLWWYALSSDASLVAWCHVLLSFVHGLSKLLGNWFDELFELLEDILWGVAKDVVDLVVVVSLSKNLLTVSLVFEVFPLTKDLTKGLTIDIDCEVKLRNDESHRGAAKNSKGRY